MNTAIILGAGASAAEGAPLQKDLFRDYFRSVQRDGDFSKSMNFELAKFFQVMFSIDVRKDDLDRAIFPTFEEAIGLLDLAERRREALRDFALESIQLDTSHIRYVRQYLVFLMARIIDETLKTSPGYHKTLVDRLFSSRRIRHTVFVSTNYDILIDNALGSLYGQRVLLDYGLEFTNFENEGDWERPDEGAVKLFKIHGSLNWLYCPTCNTLTLTPYEKGVMRLLTDDDYSTCRRCDTPIVPIIVPPTYFKDMSNIFLATVWHKIEQALRSVNHLIFCGYSFPDADMHLKYILKRIQTNRRDRLRITVFNQHEGKKEEIANEEKVRYQRFLGADVDYTNKSFQEFVENPSLYLGRP